jgi:hypothetical protein
MHRSTQGRASIMRKPKPIAVDAAREKDGRKAGVPVSDTARNTVAPSVIRPFIRPPTREQLMAGSANLRRVYKVES